MYAIAFDLKIDDLKKAYGEPYNRAYDEIRQEMETLGFNWTQGSLYINSSNTDNLAQVYKAINKLSKINWFKDSVRDIRAFKVEDWSDFTSRSTATAAAKACCWTRNRRRKGATKALPTDRSNARSRCLRTSCGSRTADGVRALLRRACHPPGDPGADRSAAGQLQGAAGNPADAGNSGRQLREKAVFYVSFLSAQGKGGVPPENER